MSRVAVPPSSGDGIIPSDELESVSRPKREKRSTFTTAAIIVGTLVGAVVTYLLLPTAGEGAMTELQRRTVAIFIIACIFWATEVIPLFATSLCVIGLQILFLASKGGLAGPGVSDLSFTQFLAPFSNPVIILFLGGLLMASAVEKHGLDRAIALKMLRPLFARPTMLMMGVLLLSAFFSMWLSNTATTAMMLAIIAPIIAKSEMDQKFVSGLILAVPFGANIGGIGTPIGTPPNAVALAALRKAGYNISFLDWMLLAVPLMVLGLILVAVVLYVLFRPPKTAKVPEIKAPEKIDLRGKLTLGIAGLAVVLWLTGTWHGVDESVVALIAAALLCALGVLGRSDVDSLDWNVLLLMWGGLSLGAAMQQTGLVTWLVNQPVGQLQGIWLGGLFIVLGVGLGTFMSHTAATNLLVPVALAFGAASTATPADGSEPGLQQGMLVILAALASSFAMAMPVSTPPNALAFATGQIRAKPDDRRRHDHQRRRQPAAAGRVPDHDPDADRQGDAVTRGRCRAGPGSGATSFREHGRPDRDGHPRSVPGRGRGSRRMTHRLHAARDEQWPAGPTRTSHAWARQAIFLPVDGRRRGASWRLT